MSNNDDKTVVISRPFRVAAGTRLNGIYEVESLIGSGGMSEIYKGRNIQTQDEVAIKVILPEFAQDEQMVALFRREALTLNRLSNEAIVRYHVFSHDAAANLLYLAMEFVDGPTLRDSIKQRPLSQQEACLLISKVAAGMQAAHAEGVIHRDLSTDNIILSGNSVSKPKVIDFGIARSSEINDSTLIASGFAGKYNFVSPEQLGLFGGKVRETSDIYSLGLVFAAALLGRPLDMAGSHADVVMKRQSVPDLSMINPGVRPLIENMLRPRPAMRPQTMGDIVEALQKWLPARGEQTVRGSRPVRAKPVALAGNPAAPAERRSQSGMFVLLLLAAGAGAAWYGLTQTAQGQKLAATWAQTIIRVTTGRSAGEAASPDVLVNPATGKSELKAGDAAGAPGTEAREPEPAVETAPVPDTGTKDEAAAKGLENSAQTSGAEEAAPQADAVPVEPEAAADTPVEEIPAAGAPETQLAAKAPSVEPAPPPESGTAAGPAKDEAGPNPSEWVAQYYGGACFHAIAGNTADGKMSIEGFGDRVEPFEKLDKSFQRTFGKEPQIRLRAVTKSQCPVIDFARQTQSAMAFSLKSDLLKSGDPVDAKLSGVTAGNVSVFVVTPDGIAVNVTSLSSRFDDEVIIQIPGSALVSKAGGDYLLLAIASGKALRELDTPNASDLKAFLRSISERSGEATVTGAVKYLRKT